MGFVGEMAAEVWPIYQRSLRIGAADQFLVGRHRLARWGRTFVLTRIWRSVFFSSIRFLVEALRMEWPRIPLPGWPDGNVPKAANDLVASAARGRELAALLESDTPVPGVTEGALRPEIAAIAVPTTVDGRNMTGDDFALTAAWGHLGQGDAVMPGQGRAVERPYTVGERVVPSDVTTALGAATYDVYLNDHTYWRNVPAAVWNYELGGYQVLKKWLSYRERKVLGRPLSPEEVLQFTGTARRIAAILGVAGK